MPPSSPLVSAVIPCFNHGHFLHESIGCLLAQTIDEIEILVVDDGSTASETIRILAELSYPRTRVLHKENGGPASTRNWGIRQAKAPYVLVLDADDAYHPAFLEKALKIFREKPEVGIISSYQQNFGQNRKTKDRMSGGIETFVKRNLVPGSSLMRKECWEKVGGYDESLKKGYEDWEFWIRVAAAGWNCEIIPEYLFYYRTLPVSRNTESDFNRLRSVGDIVDRNLETYRKHVKEVILFQEEQIKELKKKLEKTRTSPAYRLGRFLLSPWSVVRGLVQRHRNAATRYPLNKFYPKDKQHFLTKGKQPLP